MNYTVPEEFQRELDAFNGAQGNPEIVVVWNPKKERWVVWAVPISDNSHPDYNGNTLRSLCQPLPDGSGRMGVLLFSWAERDQAGKDVGYLPLDQRLIQALKLADTYQDKDHFDNSFTKPEIQKQVTLNHEIRDIVYGARSYWWGLNNLTVGSYRGRNPSADWRWRIR